MTKQELIEMAQKLQSEADNMSDDVEEKTEPESDTTVNNTEEIDKQEITENGELEEKKQIEPQTNGKITDDVTPSVDTQFTESTEATEITGVEEVLSANLDQRFATMLQQYTAVKTELDKMKVVLSEILTRIELVQEVTDKVTTVDHDSLLSESIKLLV